MAAKESKYKVLIGGLRHDGKPYVKGTVLSLTEDQAKHLLALNAIEAIAESEKDAKAAK